MAEADNWWVSLARGLNWFDGIDWGNLVKLIRRIMVSIKVFIFFDWGWQNLLKLPFKW